MRQEKWLERQEGGPERGYSPVREKKCPKERIASLNAACKSRRRKLRSDFGFRNKETISYIGKKFLWTGRGKIKAVGGEVSCNQRHKTASVDKLLKVAERGQRGRWEEAVMGLCA